jgi:hypothetical protein
VVVERVSDSIAYLFHVVAESPRGCAVKLSYGRALDAIPVAALQVP